MVKETELTDQELRQELTKYGISFGPILPTTRPIYLKKLLKTQSENKIPGIEKPTNGNHSDSSKSNKSLKQTKIQRKTFGFSSDESDGNEVTDSNKSRAYTTRRTKRPSPVNQSTPKDIKKPVHRRIEKLAHVRPTRRSVTPPVANGYSDDSEEEVTSADVSTSPRLYQSISSRSSMTPRRPLTQTMTSSMTSSVEHNGVKSLRKRKFDSTKDDDDDDSVSQENDSAEDIVTSVKESESSKTNIFTYLKSLFLTKDKEKFGNSKPTLINSWRLHCSVLLPIGTVVFFIILGLLYVTMRSDNSTHEERLLDAATQTSSQSDSTMEVMGVVNSIYEVLSKAAGEKICNYTQNSDILKVKEMKILLKVKEQIFYEALDLIRANPDWKLMLYKDADSSLIGGDDSIRDVVSMSSLQPFIPTLCRFWRAVEKVLFRVTVVVLVMIAVWLAIILQQYRARKLNEEKQMMFDLVDKILDVLKKHYESARIDESIQPFLPILHARDMIIQPQDRKKLHRAWEKAVHFLSASESRIRVETQRISGEDFMVWRWIQVTSPSKKQQTPGRVWQGEAFDTNRSINTPNISPTPCLKIRNMFERDNETGDNWHVAIQDSILEKCRGNNGILCIRVEKASTEALVYMKCSTNQGAGQAFKSLHGSWFDGRLVTVKFISLNRFHSHYPDSVGLTTPLTPTSSTPVSTFLPPSPGFTTSTPLHPH